MTDATIFASLPDDLLARIARDRLYTPATRPLVLPRPVIEPDGRRRVAVLTRLTKAGYLRTAGAADEAAAGYPRPAGAGETVVVDDAFFADAPAAPLDLVARWDERFRFDSEATHTPVVRFACRYGEARFPAAALVELWRRRDDLRWHVANAWSLDHGQRLEPGKTLFGPFDHAAALDVARADNRELVVSSAELEAHAAARVREAAIEAAFRANLGWGLAQAGLVTPAEAALFAGARAPFSEGGRIYTGDDPAAWPEALAREEARILERLGASLRLLEALHKVRAGLAAAGGWDGVAATYRAALGRQYDAPDPAAAPDEDPR